jgi:hypothetical protein
MSSMDGIVILACNIYAWDDMAFADGVLRPLFSGAGDVMGLECSITSAEVRLRSELRGRLGKNYPLRFWRGIPR